MELLGRLDHYDALLLRGLLIVIVRDAEDLSFFKALFKPLALNLDLFNIEQPVRVACLPEKLTVGRRSRSIGGFSRSAFLSEKTNLLRELLLRHFARSRRRKT